MQLSSKLEKEFDNFVVEQLKKEEENMRVISPSMHNFLNRASIEFFGKSFDEAMNETQKAIGETQKAMNETQKAIGEKREAQKIIVRSIINFHDKMSLNAEQIANMLDIDVSFVSEVLEKYENNQI
jgi:hypothetical protein